MADRILTIADGFWNIRGTQRSLGIVNIGNQSSLVRLDSGSFVLLDSYPLKGKVAETVMELTDGGKLLEAIIHLHPYHTTHTPTVAKCFPNARLYGTVRHKQRFPDLPWEEVATETPEFSELYRDDFDFSIPAGIPFIHENPRFHSASVLAFHRNSQTLHIDDTLNWTPLPWGGRLAFHPALRYVLEPRPGAADEFRTWAEALVERCKSVRHLCPAHGAMTPFSKAPLGKVAEHVQLAINRADRILRSHARRFPAA